MEDEPKRKALLKIEGAEKAAVARSEGPDDEQAIAISDASVKSAEVTIEKSDKIKDLVSRIEDLEKRIEDRGKDRIS